MAGWHCILPLEVTMGLPSNLDATADFGLPYNNYSDVADPETDVDKTYFENLCIGAAGMSMTAPRAWVVVSAASGIVISHSAVWGDSDAVKPTVTVVSTGEYTITWATSYTDLNPTVDRVVTSTVNLRAIQLSLNGLGIVRGTVAANVATVQTCTHDGTTAHVNFTAMVY